MSAFDDGQILVWLACKTMDFFANLAGAVRVRVWVEPGEGQVLA